MKKKLNLLWKLIVENRKPMLIALTATIASSLLGLVLPLVLAETVDSILGTEPSSMPGFVQNWMMAIGGREYLVRNLWVVGLVIVGLYLLQGVADYINGRMTAVAGESVALNLRERLYRHLSLLPYAYHAKVETGDVLQRCTSDVDTVRRFLAMQLKQMVRILLLLGVSFAILWNRNESLTLYSLVVIPVLLGLSVWFFGSVTKNFQVSDEAEGKMSAVLQENLTGMRVVRAFGQQENESEKFEAVSSDYRKKSYRISRLMAAYWAGTDVAIQLQCVVSLVLCVIFALRGEITVGTLLVFSNYIARMLYPIRQMGRILSDMGKSLVAIGRINQVMEEKTEPEEPDALRPPLNGDIVFDHVTFHYDNDPPVVEDMCFTAKAGKTTAILGATGCGKSTVMLLLQRLYEPDSGAISIGGVDIRKIDRQYLRAHIGLVLQEPFLYSKKIYENLAIAQRNPSREEVLHAADMACASKFIEESENGYDTLVGEKGVTLSGGQKQRMAIGRTLLKDNQILLFDDSLSAVDTKTDQTIRENLNRIGNGLTTLIISHRITTLSQADQILVMEKGKVTMQGRHEQLINQPGLYKRIFDIQAQVEDEEVDA